MVQRGAPYGHPIFVALTDVFFKTKLSLGNIYPHHSIEGGNPCKHQVPPAMLELIATAVSSYIPLPWLFIECWQYYIGSFGPFGVGGWLLSTHRVFIQQELRYLWPSPQEHQIHISLQHPWLPQHTFWPVPRRNVSNIPSSFAITYWAYSVYQWLHSHCPCRGLQCQLLCHADLVISPSITRSGP